MSTYKRKRGSPYGYGLGYSPGGKLRSGPVVPLSVAKRRRFVPGADRVGGYYGRYAGRNAELKFHDLDIDDAVVASAGTVQQGGSINVIIQGITESQRIGRKATIRSINWRYRTTIPERDAVSDPGPGETIRVILYQDKQTNGAISAVTDILETAEMHSFRNLSNSGRYIIFLDKTIAMNYMTLASDGAGVTSQGEVIKEFVFNKNCAIPIEWSGTTGSIGETRSNTLGVLLISQAGLGGFESKIRLRFSDQ